jgi:hypothetical protein
MSGPPRTMSQTLRKYWAVVTGQAKTSLPEVIVHDPAAQRPHDLDDPFFDNDVQARLSDVIADAAKKSR